jgi:hypothetical protein
VRAFIQHIHVGHVERLRPDLAIDGIAEDLAERTGIHVSARQDGLLQILPGVLVVILTSEHAYRRRRITGLAEGKRAEYRSAQQDNAEHL